MSPGGSDMWALLLTLLACLLTSCISATREREANCLAATMMDTWQTKQDFTSAEEAWRVAQKVRFERSPASRDSSTLAVWLAHRDASSGIVEQVASRGIGASLQPSQDDQERTLYQRMVAARARHGEATKWHRLVTRRVQTRIEEDEMLYPVLGMLATSTAIVLYPLVRWNVRSVLWDGTDPDAEDDPVQRFCITRLGEATHHPQH
jgi:hypothetical protein